MRGLLAQRAIPAAISSIILCGRPAPFGTRSCENHDAVGRARIDKNFQDGTASTSLNLMAGAFVCLYGSWWERVVGKGIQR
jgi:hypothetical protein